MSIFFRSDGFVHRPASISGAAAPEDESPQEHASLLRKVAWDRIGIAVGILAMLAIAGGIEYHVGIEKIGDTLFSWTERLFTILIGLICGEALSRANGR